MCYATKRKIADCVKVLMRHKEISKITIQDVMDETHMSRQSFYYYFKDLPEKESAGGTGTEGYPVRAPGNWRRRKRGAAGVSAGNCDIAAAI